jgi:hypothetical protein
MPTTTDCQSPGDEIVAIAERASLYAVLLSALAHQRRPQRLPRRLYEDLNILPSEQPDWHPHIR